MRLEYGVAGLPPKWKSLRSTALMVHAFRMIHICTANNRLEVSFTFGTKVLSFFGDWAPKKWPFGQRESGVKEARRQ